MQLLSLGFFSLADRNLCILSLCNLKSGDPFFYRFSLHSIVSRLWRSWTFKHSKSFKEEPLLSVSPFFLSPTKGTKTAIGHKLQQKLLLFIDHLWPFTWGDLSKILKVCFCHEQRLMQWMLAWELMQNAHDTMHCNGTGSSVASK